MQIKLNRTSDAYRRMTCAGFTIEEPQYRAARTPKYDPYISLSVDFKCVCGRTEVFQQSFAHKNAFNAFYHFHKIAENGWDACLTIERLGSVSVQHLRDDGFNEEDIKRIRYVYDLEDEIQKLRRQLSMGMRDFYFDDVTERAKNVK